MPLVLAGVLLAIGFATATLVATDDSTLTAAPSGQIVSPASDTTVPATTAARGTLNRIPEGEYVWLVARDGSMLVRRGAQLPARDRETYTWRTRLKLGGTTGAVSIELYRMGDEGHRLLRSRLTRGSPGGVGTIPDAKRLDIARNVRIRR